MPDIRKHSSTSNLIRVRLRHATTGQGLTGLTSASAGLIISTIADNEATATSYTVAGSTIETITTLGTYAAPTATKCRFKEVDATNHPGLYELQFADARFAVASAKRLVVSWSGATNLLADAADIELVQFDPFDAVRLGLSAIPNVAQGNSGALPMGDANGKVTLAPVTHTSAVIPTVSALTGHTPQTGDSFARLGAPVGASIAADIAAAKAQTAAIEADTQDIQGRLPAALVSGRMDASVGAMASGVLTATAIAAGAFTAAKFAAGAFDAVWSVATRLLTAGTNIVLAKGTGVTGFNDPTAADNAAAVLTTAMTESYSTKAGSLTVAQALHELVQDAQESSISGTTKTVKKRDGSTTALTGTLDSSTSPTSIARAT